MVHSPQRSYTATTHTAFPSDCDHFGVSNAQTMKEDKAMGEKYKKSVAEQHSLDIAWNLLMSDDLIELRSYLFGNNKSEMERFRQGESFNY